MPDIRPDLREELIKRKLSQLPETKIQEPALVPETEEISSEEKVESMINVVIELLIRANMILDDILTEGNITEENILKFFTLSKGDIVNVIKNLKLLQTQPEEFLNALQPEESQSVPLRPTMTPEELATTRDSGIPSPAQIEEWQRMQR